MEKNQKTKTSSLIVLGLVFSIVFIILIQNAAAQRSGCCYKKFDGKYCEEGYEGIDCDTANFLGGLCTDSKNTAKCGVVTCALPYDCMFNVKKGKCLYEHKGTVAKGDECTKECCGVAGRAYGIKTHVACRKLAFEKGFNETYIEFVNTLDEYECAAHFEPTIKGCCISEEGCKDTTRKECADEFHADILCKKIPTRCQVTEIGLKCGKQPGNEDKVVLVDSAGGEDVQYECSLPKYRCMECSSSQCDFDANANPGRTGNYIEQFESYCADTSCSLEGIGYHQEIDKFGKLTAVPVASKILQTGQSMCYNFYGVSFVGKGTNKDLDHYKTSWDKENKVFTKVENMLGRSTGLQNHVLVCNYGDVQIVGLGDDRKMLCKDDTNIYVAQKFENIKNISNCIDCGHFTPGVIDWIGDYVSAGWALGGFLGKLISDQCNPEKCSEKIIDPVTKEPLCFFSYDTKIRLIGANPIGSCVPRFPLGSSTGCGACGGGSDGVWNICKEEECYALGNCNFKPHGPVRGVFNFAISLIGFYGANRLGGLPVETLAVARDKCGSWFNFACIPGKYVEQLPNVTGEVIKEQVRPAIEGVLGITKVSVDFVSKVGESVNKLKEIPSLLGEFPKLFKKAK